MAPRNQETFIIIKFYLKSPLDTLKGVQGLYVKSGKKSFIIFNTLGKYFYLLLTNLKFLKVSHFFVIFKNILLSSLVFNRITVRCWYHGYYDHLFKNPTFVTRGATRGRGQPCARPLLSPERGGAPLYRMKRKNGEYH